MATFLDSINTPVVQMGLLRSAVPVPTPALTAETVAMLDAIPPDVRHDGAGDLFEILHPETGHGGDRKSSRHIGDLNDRFTADTAASTGRSERAVQRDAAQALHMRRALEGALDHGTALLAALGLPRLAEPGSVPLDPAAIGDAIAHGIATLDALDAPHVDLEDEGEAEPSLGWIDGKPVLSDNHDDREAEDDDEPILGAPERHPSCYQFALCDATSSPEHWADGSARYDEAEVVNEDGGDILDEGEETLGWAANVGQLALGQTTADGDETALERHGKGFVRSGPDDAEDDDPSGGQQRDEDALFWSIDVGCAIGAPLDVEGAHV